MVFLEFLAWNQVFVHIMANFVCVIKANLVLYGLDHTFLGHLRIKAVMKISVSKDIRGAKHHGESQGRTLKGRITLE